MSQRVPKTRIFLISRKTFFLVSSQEKSQKEAENSKSLDKEAFSSEIIRKKEAFGFSTLLGIFSCYE